MPDVRLIRGDCLEVMGSLEAGSVALIVADPPYHKVKAEDWDRQWKTDGDYLEWIGRLCGAFRRVLKPNGSLYLFASPRMAARVECKVGETFEVLNRITWRKDAGWSKRQCKDEMRTFSPASEAIIFAEQVGTDGYQSACDAIWTKVFEPLRSYFHDAKCRLGLSYQQINEALGTAITGSGMAGHYFKPPGMAQWEMPTAEQYRRLRILGGFNREYEDLRREYEDLRREYEDLRREYEDLRRPFSVSAEIPYTDVWDFPTVSHRPGKHPCQKPPSLISHIVSASSRPGDVVLDPFMGSGVTGKVCRELGRPFIGIECDPKWLAAADRLVNARPEMPLFSQTTYLNI